MKTKLLFFLCSLLLVSCQDDEEFQVLRPLGGQVISGYQPCTSLDLGILSLEALEVKDGGDWTVVSSDEAVVKAEKVIPEGASYSYLSVYPLKQGKAVVTVSSETGDKIYIPVTVGTSVRTLDVWSGELSHIEGVSKEDSLLIVEHLYDDVFLRKGGYYRLTYSEKKKGKLTVCTPDGKMEEGTFVCDHEYYDLTFDGKNIHYMVMYSETGFQEVTRTEYRIPFYLVEDVTDRYRADYPTIKLVQRAQKVRLAVND